MEFHLGGERIAVNVPTPIALETEIARRLRAGEGFALATINLDHLVKLSRLPDFAAAYGAHDLVVADGHPVVWLSRLAGRRVALMPGSDMILPLCRLARDAGVRVALVGSTEPVLDDAAATLAARVPGLDLALRVAPSVAFDPNGAEADRILAALGENDVRLCFVGLGAPKQEILAAHGRRRLPQTGFASVGAGLDFLGDHQRRAPRWMRAMALEWLWRAITEPRRMVPRYLRCFTILPGQTVRALRQRVR